MLKFRILPAILVGLVFGLVASAGFAQNPDTPAVDILATDPVTGAELAFEDRLYLRLGYQSAIPLRFEPRAFFQGEPRTFAAQINHPRLHPPGEGEALAWITFADPTHIDEIRINLLDAEWRPVGSLGIPIDLHWRAAGPQEERQPAAWVEILSRAERRKMDYVYDPVPQQHGLLTDIMFLVTVVAAPIYLLLQVQMLRKYRGRWRELAAVPLITAVPLTLYALLVGFGFDPELWLAFLFRCTPFALLYLLLIWFFKNDRGPGREQAR